MRWNTTSISRRCSQQLCGVCVGCNEVEVRVQKPGGKATPPAPTLTGLDHVPCAASHPAPDSGHPAPSSAHLLAANSCPHPGAKRQAGKCGQRVAGRAVPKGNGFQNQSISAGVGGAAEDPNMVATTCCPLQSSPGQAIPFLLAPTPCCTKQSGPKAGKLRLLPAAGSNS